MAVIIQSYNEERRVLMDRHILILLIVGGGAVYILPFIIAGIRKAEHRTAIFWVNLFFGWTLLGWLAALVWAVTEDTASTASLPPVQLKRQATRSPEVHESPLVNAGRRMDGAKKSDNWVLE
jgi:hypothetical protein